MLLSFKTLSEKKTKVKINPKMNDVMEGGMPITMHPYAKGGKVKKAKIKEGNHGEDCDCMQCESKRRKDDVNDGPDVQNEAKVDKGRSDYGKASIRNYRRMGPGHGDPGMFDPSGKRGKTIEKRREEHKARRGVKGAKVPAYKREGFERFVECWKTHKKVGMKMKGGKLVNDCRPKNEAVEYTGPNKSDRKLIKKMDNPSYAKKLADYEKNMDPKKRQALKDKATKGMKFTHEETTNEAKKCWPGYEKKGTQKLFGKTYNRCVKKEDLEYVREKAAAWTRKAGKNQSGGLNEKGRKSYERENPGSDLKAPSKKVGNPRRASFCARMKGMKAKLTSKKTASDPDSRINKSLRAWNC